MKFGATISFSLVSTSVSVLNLAVVDAKRRPWRAEKIKKTPKIKNTQRVEWIQYRMTHLTEVYKADSSCFCFLST